MTERSAQHVQRHENQEHREDPFERLRVHSVCNFRSVGCCNHSHGNYDEESWQVDGTDSHRRPDGGWNFDDQESGQSRDGYRQAEACSVCDSPMNGYAVHTPGV